MGLRTAKARTRDDSTQTRATNASFLDRTSSSLAEDSGRDFTLKATDIKIESVDPLLSCLVTMTRIFGRPLSAQALRAGLPLVNSRLTPELFVKAAARADISASLNKRSLDRIPDMVLPCILLMKNGQACILTARKNAGKTGETLQIISPETGDGALEIDRQSLEDAYEGYAIFLKPRFHFSRNAADKRKKRSRSWFWGTLRAFWSTYFQVILAAVFINLFALASPLFVMNVYDRVVPNQSIETLWVLASGISLIILFDFVLKTLRTMFVDNAGKRADVILSSRIFEHVLNLKMQAKPESSGVFANRLREYESLREFFSSAALVTLIDLPFVFLFLFIIYMIGGPVVLAPGLAVPFVIISGLLLQLPLRRSVEADAEDKSQKHGIILETIGALDTVKSLGAENKMQAEWERFVGKSAKTSAGVKALSALAINLSQAAMQFVTVGAVLIGVNQIITGELSIGGLIACTIISGRAMAPLGQIAGLISRLHHSMQALKGLNEIMALPVERHEEQRYLTRPEIHGNIQFKDVDFSYPEAKIQSLSDVNFAIGEQEKVAIIGPVGCGKTTLARLVSGLFEPAEGSVLLDGTDMRQIDPADVRHAMGVVMQEVLLFQGSIRDNIAVAVPHADDDMILAAARLAGVHDWVMKNPMGYDMKVGERGQSLSGGQRQAIGLARALLLNPKILVLDEPTSMMDMRSEREFMERLKDVVHDKTLVLITHRPALLELVDRVVILGNGKVVRDGPKDEVLRAAQGAQ